jgi:dTDP-glucose 4,6-dehydratase
MPDAIASGLCVPEWIDMGYYDGKRVLITGAGGFIGSHLTEKLVALGARVRVFLRYNSRNERGSIDRLPEEVQKSLEVSMGDLKDAEGVRKATEGCEIVFHLGALIAIPYSYVSPVDFVQTNILGTMNVLNACRNCVVERLVHTSTSEVYGTAIYVPIDEKHPLQGQSPYSASKIAADKLVESYYRSFNLPVTTVRPFNTYGPRQSSRAIVPTIITQALRSDTITLGSLKPTRDLMYCSDTVEGFVRAGQTAEATGEVINIGTGKEVSIGQLVNEVGGILGKRIVVEQDSHRLRPEKSEVQRLLCHNRKAKEVLNWEPQIALAEGLRRTVQWISDNVRSFRVGEYTI